MVKEIVVSNLNNVWNVIHIYKINANFYTQVEYFM
jgi:hypothetical protein